MKTSIQTNLGQKGKKSRRRLTSRQRGVAILIVLAVIVLMSVLVLSFFQMSKSEQVQSKVNADMLRSYTLRDTAINLAIGQLREATSPALDPKGIQSWLWTSQPGMIRTFNKDGTNSLLYKLYSARQMKVGGPTADTDITTEDLPQAWDEMPTEFVDLNRPVYKSKVGVAGGANIDSTANLEALYPIIDPTAYDPKRPRTDNPEGFVYGRQAIRDSNGLTNANVATPNGVLPGTGLPMPVRWLYVKQDGTIGYLNAAGQFEVGAGGAPANADPFNPIVGRIAFWTDDESCKINVNTASEGIFWDSPRCDSPEERFYAECQPGKEEYQRFPGHPAMVSLSSVLFPGKRYYPENKTTNVGAARSGDLPFRIDRLPNGAATPDNYPLDKMDKREIGMLWSLAPWISDRSDKAGNSGGSIGKVRSDGVIEPLNLASMKATVDARLASNPDDHPYTSMDELLFRAGAKAAAPERASWTEASVTSNTSTPISEEEFMTRLNRSQFLLTTKSNAPETNVWGHPRICLWPVNQEVPAIASSVTTPNGQSTDKGTLFDSIIGLTCQLSPSNYYYVLRNDPNSRHTELRDLPTGKNRQQNALIRKYLEKATGVSQFDRFPGIDATAKESMLQKYAGRVLGSNGRYSDRGAIILSMLDYIRMSNLTDPTLKDAYRYAKGGVANSGQVTAYCGCKMSSLSGDGYVADIHNTTWSLLNNPDPKGPGRVFTPSEVAFVIVKVGETKNGALITNATGGFKTSYETAVKRTDNNAIVDNLSVYEMGVVVEGFTPSMGWSGIYPTISANLSGCGLNDAASNNPATASIPKIKVYDWGVDLSKLPVTSTQWLTEPTSYASSNNAATPASVYPNNAPRWGGSSGIRPFSAMAAASATAVGNYKTCIMFKPFVVPTGKNIRLTKDTGAKPWDEYFWRLGIFDDASGPTLVGSVQSIMFNFGTDIEGMEWPAPTQDLGPLPKRLSDTFTTGMKGKFNDATIRGLHFPHGDYRLLVLNRVVGPNSILGGASSTKDRKHWMSLVPHPQFNTLTKNASYLFDPETGYYSDSPPVANFLAKVTPGKEPPLPNGTTALFSRRPDYPMPHTGATGWYDQFIKDTQTDLRGSCDPGVTGDFDNGIGPAPDGAYINRPDDGDLRPWFGAAPSQNKLAYFEALEQPTPVYPDPTTSADKNGKASFSPNRLIRSAVQFGSIPTGSEVGVPWQTLLFRPDPYRDRSKEQSNTALTATDPRHYGSALAKYPKDHMWLDLFWMPVVQPYALSDTFSTKGKINMNYSILPFNYIKRNTGLHALLKAERMLTIPSDQGPNYKIKDSTNKALYRQYIDPKWTLAQFDRKFAGIDEFLEPNGIVPPKVFRTASEICELWLVPESEGTKAALDTGDKLKTAMQTFWNGKAGTGTTAIPSGGDLEKGHRLTGDNSKEAPYANIYPRLTTRSNVFKVHMTVQTIQKARSSDPESFDPAVDTITSEYRGSAIIERALDMTNPTLKATDYLDPTATSIFTDPKKRLDYFYSFRITEVKQFAP